MSFLPYMKLYSAEYVCMLYAVTLPSQFVHLIPFVIMVSQVELQTMWILISWLLKKPADQDPQCFQSHDDEFILLKLHLWSG